MDSNVSCIYNPVGQKAIVGVQARYYLPILWLAIVAAYNRKLCINVTKTGYARLLTGIMNFITCIWTFGGINCSKASIKGKAFTKSDFVKCLLRGLGNG